MKLLVCGGRDFNDRERAFTQLTYLHMIFDLKEIIHGAARGADTLAGEWAAKHGVPCRAFPADWAKYGKGAGPIRNRQMLNEGKPDGVLAFPGGRGTENMIQQARRAGLKVVRSSELPR